MAEKKVFHAVGKRKSAIARVYMKEGTGKYQVNDRDIETYFPREMSRIIVNQPLTVTENNDKFDFNVNVKGGGIAAQAEAVRLGIAKSLVAYNLEMRPALRKAGLLTRDAREVERKKYGQAGARRRFQHSKR